MGYLSPLFTHNRQDIIDKINSPINSLCRGFLTGDCRARARQRWHPYGFLPPAVPTCKVFVLVCIVVRFMLDIIKGIWQGNFAGDTVLIGVTNMLVLQTDL